MQKTGEITFGRYLSYWYNRSPRRMLHYLSYYKFASRLIGKEKRVLDVGCNEGVGTWLIAKECGYAQGVDFDTEAIQSAKSNFSGDEITFVDEDILSHPGKEEWDAVVNFDVIEHILPEDADSFLDQICNHLKPEGLSIIGTPSLISQQFASDFSKTGHVNIYSHDRLQEQMEKHFHNVFLFAANDEMIHTGYLPLAHYFIAVGCKKKNSE